MDPNNASANPAQAPPANLAAAPTAAGERRWADKYATPEELERGYWNNANETQKIIAERDALRQRVELLMPLVQNSGERTDPEVARAARRSALDEIAEQTNVPRETFGAAVAEAVRAQLAPLTQGMVARQTVMAEIPDYGQREQDVARYLAANPDLEARFRAAMDSGNAAVQAFAMEAVYHRAKAGEATATGQPRPDDASGQQQYIARTAAALPGGSSAPAHTADATASLAGALEYFDKTGDADALINEVLKAHVPEWHLTDGHPPQGTQVI